MAHPCDDSNMTSDDDIQTLKCMFGETVSEDVIIAVLESYNGNVHHAADAIMSISSQDPKRTESATGANVEQVENTPVLPTISTPSYAQAFRTPATSTVEVAHSENRQKSITPARSTGAVPKRYQPSENRIIWTDQLRNIIMNHNKGSRILIIMRGLPGSGKSHLAKEIVHMMVGSENVSYQSYIYSSDDYFMVGGIYKYDKFQLQNAHIRNKKRVWTAANQGISPIIVDNTNTEMWEFESYVRDGVRNGYIIELLEPNTPWSKNVNQLSKRNMHGVTRENIRRMCDRFENNLTLDIVMRQFRLSYPPDKTPPVFRNYPPFIPLENSLSAMASVAKNTETNINTASYDSGKKSDDIKQLSYQNPNFKEYISGDTNTAQRGDLKQAQVQNVDITPECPRNQPTTDVETGILIDISETSTDVSNDNNHEKGVRAHKLIEAQKQLEQFEQVEKDWEDGESWDPGTDNKQVLSQNVEVATEPKPPRDAGRAQPLIKSCNDWTQIQMFMQPWQDEAASTAASVPDAPIKTTDSSTCIEIGDYTTTSKFLVTTPRDINKDNKQQHFKIPKLTSGVMFDKSTSTQEHGVVEDIQQCQNQEQHFIAFRNFFKNVPRAVLRDIFDNCRGDVNWAVNLVLDSPYNHNLFKNEELSDTEDDVTCDCDCLAAYNIIPNVRAATPPESTPQVSQSESATPLFQKKPKRERKLSDGSLQLKKQIENNVTINEHHYSHHCLSIKNMRREREMMNDNKSGLSTSPVCKTGEQINNDNAVPSTSNKTDATMLDVSNSAVDSQSHSSQNTQLLDQIDFDSLCDGEAPPNEMISVNLGFDLVKKLDQLFGREDLHYPDSIQPTVNVPKSLLQLLNAHWIESITFQMDNAYTQTEKMTRYDEDFAREISEKEDQLCQEGIEDIPNFSEIMDMDVALRMYERDISQWRNNEPQNLAAKLTREKLYNLFPDVPQGVLSELLMAHSNNFMATVESLLASTDQGDLLTSEGAVEKFVWEKEKERKESLIKKEQELSEKEWPSLPNQTDISMDTVNEYRTQAEQYLQSRNRNFEKARYYIDNNKPSVASFYSDIASYHTKKYEQACGLAAASLIQYHSVKNPDNYMLDLHFLRVSEAMFSLDLFLDNIIMKLRNTNTRFVVTYIITGRGHHSPAGPRVKPATKRRLQERGIVFKLSNPGLLMARVHMTDKQTNELVSNP